jgi:hypothetical protein
MTDALGLRSFNPGNIRADSIPWKGQVGVNSHGFCVFDTMANGIRALARNLIAYQTKHDLRTVAEIITRWAPPNENDTEAYIAAVAARVGVSRFFELDLQNKGILYTLVDGIIEHENGSRCTMEDMNAGIDAALGIVA